MNKKNLYSQNVVACIWDFDKTLIPGYMQSPLFKEYNIDEKMFWEEVNQLPKIYSERGNHVSKDTIYLNHLISYIHNGPLKGLSNKDLRRLGKKLQFYPGLPEFFGELKNEVKNNERYARFDIKLEHYIISTGLAEMIRGSKIADYVDGIFGCEFIENPLPPYFSRQSELQLPIELGISQIGTIVDNTIKTRYIFEINKGVNKNPDIDVNSTIPKEDRRVPISNMIYIADGPSDIPVFSVVRQWGGKAYAVYKSGNDAEFAQTDNLLQTGRIDNYGPADYSSKSSTALWLKMHINRLCEQIYSMREKDFKERVGLPPKHLHEEPEIIREPVPTQKLLFEE
jgi:hypothetical protein